MNRELSWLCLIAPLTVPLLIAATYWASSRLLRVEDRIIISGRRSITFGVISAFILLGGLAEWAISADFAVIVPKIVASYLGEFSRGITRLIAFSIAAGVFTGVGAYALSAWWRSAGTR